MSTGSTRSKLVRPVGTTGQRLIFGTFVMRIAHAASACWNVKCANDLGFYWVTGGHFEVFGETLMLHSMVKECLRKSISDFY